MFPSTQVQRLVVSIYLGRECQYFGSEVANLALKHKYFLETRDQTEMQSETKSLCPTTQQWSWPSSLGIDFSPSFLLRAQMTGSRTQLSIMTFIYLVWLITNFISSFTRRVGLAVCGPDALAQKKGQSGLEPGAWSPTPLGAPVREMKEKRKQVGEKTVFLGQTS